MEVPRKIRDAVHQRAMAVSVALHERDASTHVHCGRVAGLCLDLGRR
jgi:hypothetical protein